MPLDGKWKRNQMGDGDMPCCGKCGKAYGDGEIGDVKNYPDDGLVVVFFTCEHCKEESQFYYIRYKPKK